MWEGHRSLKVNFVKVEGYKLKFLVIIADLIIISVRIFLLLLYFFLLLLDKQNIHLLKSFDFFDPRQLTIRNLL